MRLPFAPVALAVLFHALLACSGGGGGGGQPAPTCTRWQPTTASGPGDAAGYVPLAAGNRWVLGRSATGTPPWTQWIVDQVTGTRTVAGRTAWVLAESDLDTQAPLGEVYWALDDHGVVDAGNDDPSDDITPLVAPYYLLRFPIVAGDQFTSVDCTSLDYGQDLDGDRKNERLDVRLVVRVATVEPVETAVASFPQAARLESRITATVRATASAQSVTVESLQTEWLVPGVGPVKQQLEIPIGTVAPTDALLGYQVGSTLKGLVARRALTSGTVHAPLHAAPLGGGYLVVSGSGSPPSSGGAGAVALQVTPGGPAGGPFTLLDLAAPSPSITEVTAPALAARGAGLLAAASTWTGTGGDVRVQRIDATGAPLDGSAGRIVATAALSNPGFGGGPWLASDGTGLLLVWCELDRLQALRLDAAGQPLGAVQTLAGPTYVYEGPGSAAVIFDGTRYLVLYEWLGNYPNEELRAVHVGTDGTVAEASPLVLSAAPGAKGIRSALFDGGQVLLLMIDGRDPSGPALTLRRLAPSGAFLDGDGATGGWVLDPLPAAGASGMAFDGARTFVTWIEGGSIRLARITPAGALLDVQGGRPGVVAVDSDPMADATFDAPTPLPTGDGALELLYLVQDHLMNGPPTLRGVLLGP